MGELLEDIISTSVDIIPTKINQPIMIYGAGSLGRLARDFFQYLGFRPYGAVDQIAGQYRHSQVWKDLPIFFPNEIKDKDHCLLVICIATTPVIALRDELLKSGWRKVVFFYDVCEAYNSSHPLANGWSIGSLNKNEADHIRQVFSSWYDEDSRRHYLQFLAWRKLRTELLFPGLMIRNDNRFFIPELVDVLRSDEVFVDGGAHNGSVVKKFISITGGKYKSIYAIEPDSLNFKLLQQTVAGLVQIQVLPLALSDHNSREYFYNGFDFASKLGRRGNRLVEVESLDRLRIPATFIKLHLEGGELNALKGSIQTIQKYRPILSVTLYHNADGVWRTSGFLMNQLKDYRYYFRLHSWGGTGAVLYAIPKERFKQQKK